jgi:Protein of unknown function (DUF2911)
MKKTLLLIASWALFSLFANGQNTPPLEFKAPPSSTLASFKQQFGTGEITVTYSRPLAKGRKIFGGLVPYDSLWRTGAHDCSTLEWKEALIIGGKKIRGGKYALFSIPGKETWTIILNTDASLHGVFGYDSAADLHRFQVKAEHSERFYETFTIEINDLSLQGEASLNLMWEHTLVRIPLRSAADEAIMSEIKTRLLDKQEQNASLLFQAAGYYHATGRDLQLAASWAAQAEKLDAENYAYPNLAQKILSDLQQNDLALAAARRALALAEKKKLSSAVSSLKTRIEALEAKLNKR